MSLFTSLFQLLYFTFLHNADAIAYLMGIVVCFGLLLSNPRRRVSLFLLGFVLLELRFQYIKHIVDPLYDQTVGAMLQHGNFFTTQRFFDLILNDLTPFLLYVFGWGSIFLGIFFSVVPRHKTKTKALPTPEDFP